jgi:hypothetical protein
MCTAHDVCAPGSHLRARGGHRAAIDIEQARGAQFGTLQSVQGHQATPVALLRHGSVHVRASDVHHSVVGPTLSPSGSIDRRVW